MPMVGTGASRLAQEAAQDKGINNDVHRLEPMQGKEPAHFLAHFLRHSSSTSGDQGEVLVRNLACGGPVIPFLS